MRLFDVLGPVMIGPSSSHTAGAARIGYTAQHFVDVLPETVQKIAVMDRTKEPGSIGEPLYQDVVSALYEAGKTGIKVVGGRYGLGSKDTPPASAFAVFE